MDKHVFFQAQNIEVPSLAPLELAPIKFELPTVGYLTKVNWK
jgi:hypothetical protein